MPVVVVQKVLPPPTHHQPQHHLSPKATQPRGNIQKKRAIYVVGKRESQLSEQEGREGEKRERRRNEQRTIWQLSHDLRETT